MYLITVEMKQGKLPKLVTLQSVLVYKPFPKAARHVEIKEIRIPRSIIVDGLSW